jgi:hypothetical protein
MRASVGIGKKEGLVDPLIPFPVVKGHIFRINRVSVQQNCTTARKYPVNRIVLYSFNLNVLPMMTEQETWQQPTVSICCRSLSGPTTLPGSKDAQHHPTVHQTMVKRAANMNLRYTGV